ncbi:MAG TPA: LysR substrate-binding domain-containing protein [Usitatibacter sp.]|nr:LysR substrate-binding domain-containing protein [Usitatibacter sp.]
MNPPNLEIDLLRSFAAVADTGSFTAAAELVARTQSAVSLQIKRLEEVVGRRVFERTSRSLALTPAGETLLGYARRILELNDESVRRIAEPAVAGVIRLGITEYFVPTELPRILARFAALYPRVSLEVRMGLSSELRRAMAAKELDAVIVRLGAGERAKAIWSEPQVWVVREGLEPARGEPVALALLPPPCVLREHALSSLKRLHRASKVAFTGSSMASVQAAVAAGIGVSILPRSSLLPGMRVLARAAGYPDPGRLDIGVLRGSHAPQEIVRALERVARQSLDVLSLSRSAA